MIDLITVVFGRELSYLEIQAKSIDRYVNVTDINSIIIVVNDDKEVCKTIDPTWYGDFKHKIKIIHYSELILNYSTNGWDSQQVLKLLAAGKSTVNWSMVLDAKTWFVRPLDLNDIFNIDGKVHFALLEFSSHFQNEKHFVEELFHINFDNMIIGPFGVPFMFNSNVIKMLITDIENISTVNFADFFLTYVSNPPRLTEFILYSGYILYKFKSYNAFYCDYAKYSAWNLADWEVNNFDSKWLILFQDPTILTASIHRRAYSALSDSQKNMWISFLFDKKLIDSTTNAKNKLNTV